MGKRKRNKTDRARFDELIAWDASIHTAYYDDGEITWKASRKNDDVWEEMFERLEDDLGIETRRVRGRGRKVDIICRWGDPGNGYAGIHRGGSLRNGRNYSDITVRPGKSYSQSTAVHELGHALGLSHPESHKRDDTIMSYGAPGDLPWFTTLDEAVLRHLYF